MGIPANLVTRRGVLAAPIISAVLPVKADTTYPSLLLHASLAMPPIARNVPIAPYVRFAINTMGSLRVGCVLVAAANVYIVLT
jgi:hypothetical protein